VYGPRDTEFLRLFKAADSHLLPRPRRQPLSLVYVTDLAEAIAACVQHPSAAGEIFYVAGSEIVDGRKLAQQIAAALESWTIPLPLPTSLLWPLCLLAQIKSAVTRNPSVLSLQKYAELAAPGWVCDPSKIRNALGITCLTRFKDGVERTLAWYREQRWI
jgi:nucleoside-diphosphate-sugar epimerase